MSNDKKQLPPELVDRFYKTFIESPIDNSLQLDAENYAQIAVDYAEEENAKLRAVNHELFHVLTQIILCKEADDTKQLAYYIEVSKKTP